MAATRLTLLSRIALGVVALSVGVLLLGPFQGAEHWVGLSDKQAHALAFFTLTVLSLAAGPRMRRGDLALAIVALAAASEIAQACVGRDGSVGDVAADSVGVFLAWAPAQIVAARGAMTRGRSRAGDRRAR